MAYNSQDQAAFTELQLDKTHHCGKETAKDPNVTLQAGIHVVLNEEVVAGASYVYAFPQGTEVFYSTVPAN